VDKGVEVKDKDLKVNFSDIATAYNQFRGEVRSIDDEYIRDIVGLTGIKTGSRLLDIGCGPGSICLPLASELGVEVTGLEPNSDMLKAGINKDKSGHVNWVLGQAEKLDFPDNSFDAAIMIFSLHHFSDRLQAFSEAARVLVPGGRLLIRTCSHAHIKRYHLGRFFRNYRAIELRKFPSLRRVRQDLEESGFKTLKILHRRNSRTMPKEEIIDKVKNKYISTLSLLSEKNFEKGLRKFETYVRSQSGDDYSYDFTHALILVENSKY
jgi:ubiquinone/menaquinone biosynthesis C-methylase UbiE